MSAAGFARRLAVLLAGGLTASQPVLISFDSHPVRTTLEFGKQTGVPITYFISAPSFITASDLTNRTNGIDYRPAGFVRWDTRVPWALGSAEVSNRWSFVEEAIAQGDEIGGHAVGHFDGSPWKETEWRKELETFSNLLDFSMRRHYRPMPLRMFGFRAPLLAWNAGMFRALADLGYRYDASFSHRENTSFLKDVGSGEGPLAIVPLHFMRYAETKSLVLAMDYNLYVFQSKGKPETNVARLRQLKAEALASYQGHFLSWYSPSNRQAISFGNHFTPFNRWIYWDALTDFIRWAKKYDVVFLTHRAYVETYMLPAAATNVAR